jgi:hypothetical protein
MAAFGATNAVIRLKRYRCRSAKSAATRYREVIFVGIAEKIHRLLEQCERLPLTRTQFGQL